MPRQGRNACRLTIRSPYLIRSPNEDPIGKRIAIDMTGFFPKMTIVGVVGYSRMSGMDRESVP
jgi:hypothetical protein